MLTKFVKIRDKAIIAQIKLQNQNGKHLKLQIVKIRLTHGQQSEQLFPKSWPLSNSNRTKNNMNIPSKICHQNQATANHNKTTALENTTFDEIAIMLLCFDSLHVVYFLHIFQTSAFVSSCLVYDEDASQRREQNNWIFLSD